MPARQQSGAIGPLRRLLASLNPFRSQPRPGRQRAQGRRSVLVLESLEDRTLLSAHLLQTVAAEVRQTLLEFALHRSAASAPTPSPSVTGYPSAATSAPAPSSGSPDIMMNSVSTSDSRSVTFNYTVANADVGQPFNVVIYRATTNQFNPNDPNFAADYQPVAETTVSAANATAGAQGSVTVPIPGGLPPEPSHPYVLAVADPSETIPESNYANNSASFRIYTVAVVVPGFSYTASSPPPAWAQTMVTDLTKPGSQGGAQYDYATVFMWNGGLLLRPRTWFHASAVPAEQQLAGAVESIASSFPAGSVVDVNLIGHSRGAVVVTGVSQILDQTALPPQLQDGYLELTLIDPHPANNLYLKQGQSFPLTFLGLVVFVGYVDAQAIMNDPPIVVPPNVDLVTEYYQETPSRQTPWSDVEEHLLNLWGLPPSDITIEDSQSTLFQHQFVPPPTGHSEMTTWYTDNILPSLYNGPA